MKYLLRAVLVVLVSLLAASLCFAGGAQEKGKAAAEKVDLTYWSVCNFPEYDPFWEEIGRKFSAEHPEVDMTVSLTCIPYQGYEAKYKSAFESGKGPDMFWDMTHVTAGQLKVSEKMPEDLAKMISNKVSGPGEVVGIFEGERYGVPVEGGYFMMMFINDTKYQDAGLDPNNPAETYLGMLEEAKKLTKYGSDGSITEAGYAIRYSGHPFGIADKALPFVDAWGTKVLDWEEKKASGYVDSPAAVESVDFYGDLVQEHKVASVELGKPMEIFGQGIAGIMFRESFAVGWMNKMNPDLDFSVHPLPKRERPSGYAGNFPWSIQINKNAPEVEKKWAWEMMRFYVESSELRKEHSIVSNVIPPWSDIIDDPAFTDRPDYDAYITMARGRAATNYHIPPAQEVLQSFGQAVLDVMFGRAEAKPALDKSAAEIDKILSRY